MQSIRQVFNVAKTKLTSDIEEKDFREESLRVFEEERLHRNIELRIWDEEKRMRERDLLHQQKEARALEAEDRMRRRDMERTETSYLLDKIDLMERDINLQFRAQARTREANNIILGGISTVSAVLGGFVMASLVEAPLERPTDSNFTHVPDELVYGFGISGVAAVACLLWVTVTSIILLIHFMRQRTQLLDDVAARRIYTYAKNTFVAGILLFFTHMAFFCWLKFLFYGFMLPVVCNIVLLFAVVVTIFMLLEAGMCGGMQDEGQPATTTAPWASEQLYSEVVMELYDDIDTHDRPEHQWGRGGRVIRRGDTQSDLNPEQSVSPRASPRLHASSMLSMWGANEYSSPPQLNAASSFTFAEVESASRAQSLDGASGPSMASNASRSSIPASGRAGMPPLALNESQPSQIQIDVGDHFSVEDTSSDGSVDDDESFSTHSSAKGASPQTPSPR